MAIHSPGTLFNFLKLNKKKYQKTAVNPKDDHEQRFAKVKVSLERLKKMANKAVEGTGQEKPFTQTKLGLLRQLKDYYKKLKAGKDRDENKERLQPWLKILLKVTVAVKALEYATLELDDEESPNEAGLPTPSDGDLAALESDKDDALETADVAADPIHGATEAMGDAFKRIEGARKALAAAGALLKPDAVAHLGGVLDAAISDAMAGSAADAQDKVGEVLAAVKAALPRAPKAGEALESFKGSESLEPFYDKANAGPGTRPVTGALTRYPSANDLQAMLTKLGAMDAGAAQVAGLQGFSDLLGKTRGKVLADDKLTPGERSDYHELLDQVGGKLKGLVAALNSQAKFERQGEKSSTVAEARTAREDAAAGAVAASDQAVRDRSRQRALNDARRKDKGEQAAKLMQTAQELNRAVGDLDLDPFGSVADRMDAMADAKRFGTDKLYKEVAQRMRDYQAVAKTGVNAAGERDVAMKRFLDACMAYKEYQEKNNPKEIAKGGPRAERYELNVKVFQLLSKLQIETSEVRNKFNGMCSEIIKQVANSEAHRDPGLSPAMLSALEEALQSPLVPDNLKNTGRQLLAKAKVALQAEADYRFLAIDNPTAQDHAAILLEFGSCKPPESKGQSDSFFIKGLDGKPRYILKSVQGEAQQSPDMPVGGGAAREVLVGKFSEQMKKDLGFDFKVVKTEFVQLEDDSFAQGSGSASRRRVGALQDAVQFQPDDPVDAAKLSIGNLGSPAEKRAFLRSINEDDAQAVAVLDFLTLNGDRHAENVLVQNPGPAPGQTRLVPIDAGQSLPTPAFFKRGGSLSLTSTGYFNDATPTFGVADNMVMQLPCAQLKFNADVQAKIAKIDPDKVVQGLRATYADMTRQAPEMAGTVGEESFELVRKSAKFLKKAAPDLTMVDISKVYAYGFNDVVDAAAGPDTDRAIDQALADFKAYKALGGDDKVIALGFIPTDMRALTIPQRLTVLRGGLKPAAWEQVHYKELQAGLKDIAEFLVDSSEKITDELTRPYSADNYKYLNLLHDYKRLGGDPMFKKLLAGNDATYQIEVKKPLAEKSRYPWMDAQEIFKRGGYPNLIAAVGQERYDRELKNGPVGPQWDAYHDILLEREG